MAGKNVIELNDQNFESEVIKSDVPVLVDFGATWCGPCKVLAPIVERLADEYAGKYKVAKMDIDEFVERIPYVETRGYVARVMGNWAHYEYLRHGESGVPALRLALQN